MPKLTLIRGLPGSGKSTMASGIAATYRDTVHIEADMYHMVKGVYCFMPERVKEAHQWCQTTARTLLNSGYNVVVSNTFTQKLEMQPYLDLGFETEILTARGNYGSVHNVPSEVIEKMRAHWEE